MWVSRIGGNKGEESEGQERRAESRSPRRGHLGQVNVGEAAGPVAWMGGLGEGLQLVERNRFGARGPMRQWRAHISFHFRCTWEAYGLWNGPSSG